jgi:hypothetical protein
MRLTPRAGAVTGHGASASAKSRRQRRRHAVQRGAALVAALLGRIAEPEPLPTRSALRVQALNGAAG